MRRAWHFLADNLIWLAGSLILAMFVWIAATIEQNPVEVRRFPQRIPIEIVTDEGMIVTNNPASSAQVVLRTQAAVWEILEAGDIHVFVDLTGREPGTYTVNTQVEVAAARRVVVEDWQPRQITVAIDRAAEVLVPVNADIRSLPPTGFEVASIAFDVPEVRVIGPASLVERVTTADVRLQLDDERNLFTREMRLTPVDEEGRTVPNVTLSPENVNVTVNIQPREDFREVFVTPNIVGEPAPGYVVYGITYEPQTILVSGRPSALEQLPGTVLTAPIDLSDQTRSFSRTVPVQLPPGVFLPTEQNITVTVEIDTLTASRRFEHLPVQVQGLEPGFEAVIAPTEVTLLITGPQPILDTLTPGDISIVADLSNLPPGNHQVPLQAVINREGLETAGKSVLPPMLEVQIAPESAGTPTPTAAESPAPTQAASPTATSPATNGGDTSLRTGTGLAPTTRP